jgi:hypothetical protein
MWHFTQSRGDVVHSHHVAYILSILTLWDPLGYNKVAHVTPQNYLSSSYLSSSCWSWDYNQEMLGAQSEFESFCVWFVHPMSSILMALQNKRTLLGNVMRCSKLWKNFFDSYKSFRCNQVFCVFNNKVCGCCPVVFCSSDAYICYRIPRVPFIHPT